MSRPRFSLGTMLLAVLSAGVAFAALKSPSELWACALFTTAVAVLLVATLGAVHRREQGRVYWLGFALIGWVYLLLSLAPVTAPQLATTGLLDVLFARVHGHGHAGQVISLAISPQGDRLITPRSSSPYWPSIPVALVSSAENPRVTSRGGVAAPGVAWESPDRPSAGRAQADRGADHPANATC